MLLCCLYDIVINENCTGQTNIIKVVNKLLENTTQFKYFEKKLEKMKIGEYLIPLHSEYPARPLLLRNVKIKRRPAVESFTLTVFPWV
jgi:hypothetical protein